MSLCGGAPRCLCVWWGTPMCIVGHSNLYQTRQGFKGCWFDCNFVHIEITCSLSSNKHTYFVDRWLPGCVGWSGLLWLCPVLSEPFATDEHELKENHRTKRGSLKWILLHSGWQWRLIFIQSVFSHSVDTKCIFSLCIYKMYFFTL